MVCKVETARPLDRERTARYALKVRCRDAGDEPRMTETTIQVNVVDTNDNSPVFTAQTYRGTLVENNYIGASVLQVCTSLITRLHLSLAGSISHSPPQCKLASLRVTRQFL